MNKYLSINKIKARLNHLHSPTAKMFRKPNYGLNLQLPLTNHEHEATTLARNLTLAVAWIAKHQSALHK